jgi:hypothetical protein
MQPSNARNVDLDVTSIENRQPSQNAVIRFPLASTQPDPERTTAQRQIQVLLERAIFEENAVISYPPRPGDCDGATPCFPIPLDFLEVRSCRGQ